MAPSKRTIGLPAPKYCIIPPHKSQHPHEYPPEPAAEERPHSNPAEPLLKPPWPVVGRGPVRSPRVFDYGQGSRMLEVGCGDIKWQVDP